MSTTLPEGFLVRPPVRADMENMRSVSQAYELTYIGVEESSLEDLRTLWDSPTFDIKEQSRLVFDPSGRLIAVFYIEQRAYVRYRVAVDVLPGFEDARVRAFLLELGENWARQEMLKASTNARIVVHSGAPSGDSQANEWYIAHPNFTEIRRFWRMEIDMSEAPPLAVWPAGVELRPFVAERDAYNVFEADEEMFRDHWGHLPADYPTWRHWSVEREHFDPSLWFVAVAGEEIVGISLCQSEPEIGWVDTLAVARSWRRKGLALALLYHSFGEFYRRGQRRVGLGVDAQSLTGATRLYERAGMHITQEFIAYEKEVRAGVELSTQALLV